jgi:uncharacterized protein YggE
MRKLIVLGAAAALLLVACGNGTLEAGSGDNGAMNGITVSGEGRVTGVPDTLTVTLGVSVLRPSVDQATGDAAAAAERVIAALEGTGVAREDMATANYSVWPEYDYSGDRQQITGYRVQNTLTVKVRDLDNAGAAIDAATQAAGDDAVVQGVSLSIDDTTGLVEQARNAAWADAEGKAEQLARLAGSELGAAVSITESTSTPVVPMPYAVAEAGAADVRTPILPGTDEVVVTIQVTFSIG